MQAAYDFNAALTLPAANCLRKVLDSGYDVYTWGRWIARSKRAIRLQ